MDERMDGRQHVDMVTDRYSARDPIGSRDIQSNEKIIRAFRKGNR